MLATGSFLNIVCVNINGVRTKYKQTMPGRMPSDLEGRVCVLTETHLRETDLERFQCQGFYAAAHHCRDTPEGERIGGGVLVLIRDGVTAEGLPELDGLDRSIEHCAVSLRPTDDIRTTILLSGVYITPTAATTLRTERLLKLTEARSPRYLPADSPHILCGDFNVASWPEVYGEWLQEKGILELLDPETPTLVLGSSLDKFLFYPGLYIPSTSLPPSDSGLQHGSEHDTTPYFSAFAADCPLLGDHFPIMLPIPFDTYDESERIPRRLSLGALTEEDWFDRDERLGERRGRIPELDWTGLGRNSEHLYNLFDSFPSGDHTRHQTKAVQRP